MTWLFGYIVPLKPELKMREFDVFQGYYCGLCKTLHRKYGLLTRMSLNYDLTFLALLLDSLTNEEDVYTREGCIINPVKKKPVRKSTSNLEYCAGLSIMMGMLKLDDDWQDDRSKKAYIAKHIINKPHRQAMLSFSDTYHKMIEKMQQLQHLEQSCSQDVDRVAAVFAEMMAELFIAPSIKDENTARVLSWLGFNLGRWVYLMDAFDDIEKDLQAGSFNVLLLNYKYMHEETPFVFRSRIQAKMHQHLTYTLAEAARSFELLDVKRNKGLLENIIYLGTRKRMEQIFNRGDERDEKSI